MIFEVAVGIVAWGLVDSLHHWGQHLGHIVLYAWLFILTLKVILWVITVIIIDILAIVILLCLCHTINVLSDIAHLGEIDLVILLFIHLSCSTCIHIQAHFIHWAGSHGRLLHMNHVSWGHRCMWKLILLWSLAFLEITLVVLLSLIKYLSIMFNVDITSIVCILVLDFIVLAKVVD